MAFDSITFRPSALNSQSLQCPSQNWPAFSSHERGGVRGILKASRASHLRAFKLSSWPSLSAIFCRGDLTFIYSLILFFPLTSLGKIYKGAELEGHCPWAQDTVCLPSLLHRFPSRSALVVKGGEGEQKGERKQSLLDTQEKARQARDAGTSEHAPCYLLGVGRLNCVGARQTPC